MSKVVIYLKPTIEGAAVPCDYLPGQMMKRAFLEAAGGLFAYSRPSFQKEILESGMSSVGSSIAGLNNCPSCSACHSLRTRVKDFKESASQRKITREHDSLHVTRIKNTHVTLEEYELYKHYYGHRHESDTNQIKDYDDFKAEVSCRSHKQMIRSPMGKLAAVLYYDDHKTNMYAAFCIYDPAWSKKLSLGTFSVLSLLRHAQEKGGVDHLYLGYWAKNSPKLGYKQKFRPLEFFDGKQWRDFDPDKTTQGPRLGVIDKIFIDGP